ncbi:MAG: DUF2723 domain-containing protein [Anaerolineae bacterium]|nr:DUF2723 domain-containing protein [Anaerolineae bacterium]
MLNVRAKSRDDGIAGRRAVIGSVAVIVLAVYLCTLAPDLSWSHWGADGGDLVSAAVTGRLPHPPGFPWYMALAQLAIRLPWGTPAWRLNLLSAVMAAATSVVLAELLLRRGRPPATALVGALSLAFAPLLWSQALITEVYTTAAFFGALTLMTALERPHTRLGIFVGGVIWGLGMAVHPTLIFLVPLWWGIRGRWLPVLVCGVMVGLLPYVLMTLLGIWPQPWGDLRAFAGWWEYVTARLYWGYAFALPLGQWPRRLLAWAVLLVKQFTPVGVLLLLAGLRFSPGQEERLALRTGVAFGAASLYAIGYNTIDSLVYLTPFLALTALWVAEGLAWLVKLSGRQHLVWWGLVLPLAALLWHWNALDLHQDWTAQQWWEAVLSQTPEAAVLVTAEDAHTFALWYAQEALGLRPDVTVVDRDLWAQPAYREYLVQQTGQVVDDFHALGGGGVVCFAGATGVRCP